MGGVSITTTGGTEIMIREEAIGAFRASLRGDILEPRDAQYDDSRKIWNGMIDKRPALIVRCAGVSDVLQCVRFARSHQVPVAVRGGGHNVAGYAMCNGGMVIDLARMRSVQVDPVRRTARAEGGAIWADVDHETQAFGLATTGGTVSDTGIGGLTLGGGFGWLMGKHGLTCDNLLSLDMVTADGQFRTVRATEHPDLFWAVRGGGGNFGVVTAFEYQLHPVGPVVAGMLLYPVAQAKSVLAHCCDFLRTAPEELGVVAGLLTSPEGAQLCGVVVCYNGPQAAGERVLQPLRAFGTPSLDSIGLVSYHQVQTMLDPALPRGRKYYVKANLMRDVSDGAIETLVQGFATVPSRYTMALLVHLGAAPGRVRPEETAFYYRETGYHFEILSGWDDAQHSEANIAWTRQLWNAMQPFGSGGIYINQMVDEGEQAVRTAYGPVAHQRLVDVKTTYDPLNLFRHNQNIRPRS